MLLQDLQKAYKQELIRTNHQIKMLSMMQCSKHLNDPVVQKVPDCFKSTVVDYCKYRLDALTTEPNIPHEVIERVRFVYKSKLDKSVALSLSDVRIVLKLLKLRIYLEHSRYIMSVINNPSDGYKHVPSLDDDIKIRILTDIEKIRELYKELYPKKNFFPSEYVIAKLFQRYGMHEFQQTWMPLNYSKHKMEMYDAMWQNFV